ncbi:hypothetical protein BJ742DRAFT_735805 [Cladochytrium replicatum]|nr:hypothetical protein BJ742DRAFT_735805 [Cladochytrium replicatum]
MTPKKGPGHAMRSLTTIILIVTFMLFFAPGWDPSVRDTVSAFDFSDFFGGGGQQQNGGSSGDSRSGNQQQENAQGGVQQVVAANDRKMIGATLGTGSCAFPQNKDVHRWVYE